MKKASIFLLIAVFYSIAAHSQEVIKIQQCDNPAIQKQADSLKEIYAKDGFKILREASVAMESEYELPVVAPLDAGSWYQFVFIGDVESRLYEVRMYDWQEKMVVYQKKMWGDVEGNIISFSYIPKSSEPHLFKPLQQNKKKKKNLCGYVLLLKKIK